MIPEFEKFLMAMRKAFEEHQAAVKKQADDAVQQIKEAAHAALIQLQQVPQPGPLTTLPEPAPVPVDAPIESMPQAFTDQDAEGIPDEPNEEFMREDQRNIIITTARSCYGLPYKYGGGDITGPTVGIVPRETEKGFDCSGLVVYSFAQAGIEGTQRTSQEQYLHYSDRLVSYEDTKPGDLMFSNFKEDLRQGKYLPDHVSIIAPEDHKVIEAGDPVGLYGIGNRGEVKYAHIFDD